MLSSALNINPITAPSTSDSLQPGSSFLLRIEKLVAGGLGLARWNGQVVLCRDAIPGETALVTIEARRRGVHYGKILEVQYPAPTRIVPVCPYVGSCGGCQLQHVGYEEQLRQKQLILQDALSRIGKLPGLSIPPVIPSPNPMGIGKFCVWGLESEARDGSWDFLNRDRRGFFPLKPASLCQRVFETRSTN